MKKFITTPLIIIMMIPFLMFGQSKQFIEANIGLAAIGSYEVSDMYYPGCSVLYGRTTQMSETSIVEWEIGLSAPSVLTGKIGVGFGTIKNNFMMAIRPWPLTVGPQLRMGSLLASFEFGTESDISFGAGLIATVGYRFNIKSKKEKEAYKETL
tara:strand:+ start:2215 stop:2676 length:462 start_codon:yes stop_codon:yes gene_type:complete